MNNERLCDHTLFMRSILVDDAFSFCDVFSIWGFRLVSAGWLTFSGNCCGFRRNVAKGFRDEHHHSSFLMTGRAMNIQLVGITAEPPVRRLSSGGGGGFGGGGGGAGGGGGFGGRRSGYVFILSAGLLVSEYMCRTNDSQFFEKLLLGENCKFPKTNFELVCLVVA